VRVERTYWKGWSEELLGELGDRRPLVRTQLLVGETVRGQTKQVVQTKTATSANQATPASGTACVHAAI
jgi:hypothetical protein